MLYPIFVDETIMRLQDLGNRIRAQREKRGLKQTDIAHALQVSPQAVSKWERAENAPDITILGTLAKLLGVSADWLLGLHAEDLDVFEATVFVSSVSGAYGKSLGMKPRDFASWANGFFYPLTEAVLRFDGVPIKYMGDELLSFFSGANHQQRALKATRLSYETVNEPIVVGLSSGEIYLGSVGHPDYACPDIMGKTVNLAFLVMGWAETNTVNRAAITQRTTESGLLPVKIGKTESVFFKGISHSVSVDEILF